MLARKSLLIFLNNVLSAFAGMGALVLVGRFMTPTAYGMFAWALGAAMLVGHISRLGLDKAHEKRVSEGQELGDCLVTYTLMRSGIVIGAAVAFAGSAWAWHTTRGFFDATTITTMLVMALYIIAEQGRIMVQSTFNGQQHTAKAQLAVLVENATRLVFMAIVAVLFGAAAGHPVPFRQRAQAAVDALGLPSPIPDGTGAALIAMAYLLAMAVSLMTGVLLMRLHRYPWGSFDRGLMRSYLRFALPIAGVSVLGSVSLHVDKLMLGFFWSPAITGHFFAAQRIATAAIVIPGAIGTIFFPMMSELAAAGRVEGVRAVAKSTQRVLGLTMAIVGVILFAFAPQGILLVLGADYLPATTALRILAFHTVLTGLITVPSSILMGFGHPKDLAITGAVIAGGNILLNVLLIPDSLFGFGLPGLRAEGAAIATVVSTAAGAATMLYFCHRRTGIFPWPLALARHTAAALGAGVLGWSMQANGFPGGLDRWYELGAAGLAVGLVYLAALVLLREVGRKDWLLVVDMLHPWRLVEYVRDELRGR